MTEVLGVVAAAFGIVLGASPLLQARRVRRLGGSEDVSISFLLVLSAGGTAWLSYGIALGNAALIVANVVGVSASLTTTFVVIRWRRRASAGGASEPAA